MFSRRTLASLLSAGCIACGAPSGPYETAGIVTRSSGGDEVIANEGEATGSTSGAALTGPIGTSDELRTALERGKARRENELGKMEAGSAIHRRLFEEIRAIDEKLRNTGLALLRQRNAFVLAEGSLETFVYHFASDREWEIDYALRSGDLGLASSIVQDVVLRYDFTSPPRQGEANERQEEGAIEPDAPDFSIQDAAAQRLDAEAHAAGSLLRLAQLAIEGADFAEAERLFRAALAYNSKLGVKTDILNGYAALLELLGRAEEAREMDEAAARAVIRGGP